MSGYLRHLPPALWSHDLCHLLKIFEKLLSGIDDDVHAPQAVERTIDELPDLYDPAWARELFLPWLAAWVGLELLPHWDERRRRQVIARYTRLQRLRGTAAGLAGYLELAIPEPERQRITLDGRAKVLFTRPVPEGESRMHTLLSQGPFIRPRTGTEDQVVVHSGLVSPQSMVLTPDGCLVVGDAGGLRKTPGPGVWRITRSGEYADLAGVPPVPTPLGHPGWELTKPSALALNPAPIPSVPSWQLYILDEARPVLKFYRIDGNDLFTAKPLPVSAPSSDPNLFKVFEPSAMAYDQGHLFVVSVTTNKLIDITLAASGASPAVTRTLTGLDSPHSLLVSPDGSLLVGDARKEGPAELFHVDRSGGTPRPLLGLPGDANPLLAPYGLARQDDRYLLVADGGLQPDPAEDPYLRRTLRPPALYRVDLGADPPLVTRVTEPGGLVLPRSVVWREGTAYLCDAGEPPSTTPVRNFRASANEFGAVVHFATAGTSEKHQRKVLGAVREILDRERPASALLTLLSAIGTTQE